MSKTFERPFSSSWRIFFLVAALYDLILGGGFLVAGEPILTAIGLALPPHIAYIQLGAVFVFVQGVGYWIVYRDPYANLGIVRIGIAYKAGYAGLALYYVVTAQLPSVFFIPWAVIDVLFLVGFARFLQAASRSQAA